MSAFTVEQYNALVAAIAKGVREVSYGGNKVVYNSMSEMLQLKSLIESELSDELGITPSPRASLVKFNLGR